MESIADANWDNTQNNPCWAFWRDWCPKRNASRGDVNLALVSVGQNEIVKRLASWAAILAIPTMIASFYGMNFDYMPELRWHLGYPTAMIVMLCACLWLYRRLKRAKWL